MHTAEYLEKEITDTEKLIKLLGKRRNRMIKELQALTGEKPCSTCGGSGVFFVATKAGTIVEKCKCGGIGGEYADQ